MRTSLAALIVATALLSPPAMAADGQPPLGKYRCYQPPEYTVVEFLLQAA